jgi:small subunit ribosomal protein S17
MPDNETPSEEEAAVDEVVAEEASSTDEPTVEAEAETETEAEAPEVAAPAAAAAPPVEILTPKERRQRLRQRRAAPTAPQRSPEERKAERDALRSKNAKARTLRRSKLRAKKPATTAAVAEAPVREAGTQKTRQGIVVSDKAAKTITVRIDTSRRHRRYQKIVRSSKTLHAHDENNEAHEGDLVRLIETRPLSATKRWRLAEIVERAR